MVIVLFFGLYFFFCFFFLFFLKSEFYKHVCKNERSFFQEFCILQSYLGNDIENMSRGEAYFVTAGISSLELYSIFTITSIFSPNHSRADVTLKSCDCSGL